MKRSILVASAAALLAGCSGGLGGEGFGFGGYSLIRARPVAVGDGSVVVTSPREWNKVSSVWAIDDIRAVEDWTLNGSNLDSISFVTGLKGGRYIIRQSKRTAQQVPKFRPDMTAPEVTSMLESFYRVKAGTIDFKTVGLSPRQFLGYPGFQFDFDHLDTDEVWRRGRAVGAVIGGRLYLVLLDGARSHYFAAALPDFEAVANSATLRR
ncbi:MAG: lipoprotein [Pseudomonadota bacterium]